MTARATSRTWVSRRKLAWALRLSTVVVPLTVAVLAMVATAKILPRPAHGLLVAGWYGLLLAISYGASWATGKLMDRSLPLAALLEMSLTFPESAPSRLGLAQRGGSAAALTRLATAPPDESTQAAAERILKLLTALSAHDRFTRGHAERVRAYTDLIAANMRLSEGDRDRLRWAALLHDIGKLRVPASVLNKPGKPSAIEWEQLKAHPTQGSLIAAPLLEWLRPMDRVIAEHHERYDGTGYPTGLSGDAISQGARIVTVADCFEAMTAVRAYNKPMKREAALAELVRCAGTQFDPVVVRALLAVPQRRLLWAMGPTAWLAGLPMVGQGSLGVVRAAVGHAGTVALSAGAVAVAAVVPSALFTSAQADPPVRLSAAHAPALPSAAPSVRPNATTLPTTPAPSPEPALPAHKPVPHKAPHTTAPRTKTPHHAAPTTRPKPRTTTPQPTVTTTHPVVRTTPAPTTPAPTTTTTAAPTTPPTTKPPAALHRRRPLPPSPRPPRHPTRRRQHPPPPHPRRPQPLRRRRSLPPRPPLRRRRRRPPRPRQASSSARRPTSPPASSGSPRSSQ